MFAAHPRRMRRQDLVKPNRSKAQKKAKSQNVQNCCMVLMIRRHGFSVCCSDFRLVFSRSYCYTVWSAIGIILLSVCPSVCLWRCALCLSGSVYRAKSLFQHVPSMQVPIRPFRHFCCRMYRLATKCTTKSEVRNAISVYGTQARLVCQQWRTVHGTTAGVLLCADCGLGMQIRSNCWIRGLTANRFFYSEVEMLRSQWIALKYCMQYDRLSQQ